MSERERERGRAMIDERGRTDAKLFSSFVPWHVNCFSIRADSIMRAGSATSSSTHSDMDNNGSCYNARIPDLQKTDSLTIPGFRR